MTVFTNFCIFLMASVGLSIILTKGRIFIPFRAWLNKTYEDNYAKDSITSTLRSKALCKTFWFLRELVLCNLCMGFWTGLFIYLAWYRDLSWNIFIFGLVSSIASFTYAEALEYVKRH